MEDIGIDWTGPMPSNDDDSIGRVSVIVGQSVHNQRIERKKAVQHY